MAGGDKGCADRAAKRVLGSYADGDGDRACGECDGAQGSILKAVVWEIAFVEQTGCGDPLHAETHIAVRLVTWS